MKNIDSFNHLTGKSLYIDDLPESNNIIYVGLFESPVAHGSINSIDYTEAEKMDGIVGVLNYQSIPGENQIGGIILDEPLLAEKIVEFIGQPILAIYGESKEIIRKAIKTIKCEIETLSVITDETDAFQKKNLLFPSRSIQKGDIKNAFAQCTYVFDGTSSNGSQEHLYLETQGAYAIPQELGRVFLYSSTQGATAVQKVCARVLGLQMHQIEVDVPRLGGGFGGKEDQANAIACFAAMGAYVFNRPCKLTLERHEDMVSTGKRHPYTSHYKIGLDEHYKIQAFEIEFYQNSGAFADLSPAIMERTLFHSAGAYYIPNMKTTVHACKTNLPPNTAFRGFGAPQAMFAVESAIYSVAKRLNISVRELQYKNLIRTENEFHYGQQAKSVHLEKAYDCLMENSQEKNIEDEIRSYNLKNDRYKKGISYFPLCFGISFTKSHMNQASSLIHIYQDGSVGISTAAVEMGQGVNTKIVQIVQDFFGLPPEKVRINSTNTMRIANTSPTAASSSADLNGKATLLACERIKLRLQEFVESNYSISDCQKLEFKNKKVMVGQWNMDWEQFILQCFFNRVQLSEYANYATPNIQYDLSIEQGTPFAYHVFGAAKTVVTMDCLLGTYVIDEVNIAHDFGRSMNLDIDMGQVEGALAQGIGWMTMEEITYDKNGKNLASNLSTYKVPDMDASARVINVIPLQVESEEMAVLGSKAVGEPPFMYGIGTYFALLNAIEQFNPNVEHLFQAPMTPEKVLKSLYDIPHGELV